MLSTYPPSVLERAASPSRGLPAFVSYPNLAKFKELLDQWNAIFWEEHAKRSARLSKPTGTPRIEPGRLENPPQGHFANVHIFEEHERYAKLVEWAKTADPKWWKFGRSTNNKPGIWIPLSVWQEMAGAMKQIGSSVPPDVQRDQA